jgi:hypothetical protein
MMRIIIMNLSFLNKFLRDILLISAKRIIRIKIIENIIKLLTIKMDIVSKIKKKILDIGFNLCINEFPGK